MFRIASMVTVIALILPISACETESAPAPDGAGSDTAIETTVPTDTDDRSDEMTPEPDLGTADTNAEPDTSDSTPDAPLPGPDTGECPPSGPTGTALGDRLADTTLTSCDGTSVSLHSYCGRPLYISTFAGWCPPCRTDAANAAATATMLPPNAQWLFVITETNNGSLPTTAYCESIRDAYGLTMPVAIDTRGTFPAHIGVSSPNSWHLVLDADFGLIHRAKFDQRGALDALNSVAR